MNKMKRMGYDQISIDADVKMEETEDEIIFRDVIIAREIVQPYDIDGKMMNAYKPAKELEDCAWTGEGLWIRMDGHPEGIVINTREDIHGRMLNVLFVKNLMDAKTKRPNQRGVKADLHFFKRQISQAKQDDLKALKNRDVSIGFFYTADIKKGEWNSDAYDFVQRSICLNHLAAPIPVGRCTMPYCGIGADALPQHLFAADPEETKTHIHIPLIQNTGQFETCRTTDFEGKLPKGVQAVYCKYKDSEKWTIQKYIFTKKQDWTMAKAKKWVKQHKGDETEMTENAVIDFFGNSEHLKTRVKRFVEIYTAVSQDMTLKDVEAKLEELRTERKKLRNRQQELYTPSKQNPEIEELYEKLSELEDEIRAYVEAKVRIIANMDQARTEAQRAMAHFKITPEKWAKLSEEEKQAYIKKLPPRGKGGDWFTKISWKDHKEAFEILPEDIQNKIIEANLCPDCPAIDYDKAPEDKEWKFVAADYSMDQLKHACAVVLKASGEEGELTKADCKLPHHLPGDGKSHGGKLVWRGVAAAGAALGGARGAKITGETADKAKAHLAKHYTEFDKEPPWKGKDDKPKKDVLPSTKEILAKSKEVLEHPDLFEE